MLNIKVPIDLWFTETGWSFKKQRRKRHGGEEQWLYLQTVVMIMNFSLKYYDLSIVSTDEMLQEVRKVLSGYALQLFQYFRSLEEN